MGLGFFRDSPYVVVRQVSFIPSPFQPFLDPEISSWSALAHVGLGRLLKGCSLRHRSHEECDQAFAERLQFLDSK